MASDDIWILGIKMTKFGKHPDKDMVDLACDAVLGALCDADVTMRDIGVVGAGSLMAAQAGSGQVLDLVPEVALELGQVVVLFRPMRVFIPTAACRCRT